MEYYNYYNPNFNPNFNPNYNYAYNNYPPRPVVYPQAQPPVPRKPEAPSASINSMPPSSLSHQSQPFFPTNHNLYAPQPAPYRPPFHPQVHNFVPQTGGDNPDDDSLPLIYHYPQHVPVFRPEQFANNPANPKLSAEYTANSQSPFLEKREYLKRQLQLSPTTKQQFTDFFRLFKLKEKEGFEATKKFAAENFAHLPPKVHWKVYLEMADLAKRENKFKEARKYYEIVNHIQPYGCKGWLEYAKMEEESGRLHDCTRILADGLYFCPHSESLLVKGIKHSERMDNIDASRALLSRLKNVAIERSWRTIMEGGLLESRQGNISVARQIFKYLMEKVPSYGPIYTEAVRLEMRMEEYSRGLKLVEKGLQRIPSYGPLWFLAIKLEERLGKDFTKRVEEAVPNLSKELVWKIYFELAQIEERKGNFKNCYKAYVQSVLNCPSRNLVWKVWLGGARTELHKGNIDASRKLLFRALQNVPSKMKATALLECARFEEFLGDLEDARYILRKAKKETRHEWKVFLESVLLEMRANELDRALNEVSEALDVHSTTGRLWAVLIQLTHLKNLTNDSVSAQTKVFRNALTNVPKSGEVWCEGARIALHQGLLDSARKYLDFAIQFTPQYGDSFIEHLRLEMLCLKTDDIENALELPESKAALDKLELQCLNAEPTYGVCWTYCKEHPLDSARQCLRNAKRQLIQMAKERASMSKMKVSDMTPQQLRKWKILETLDIAASFFGEKSEETEAAQKEFKFRTIFS
uniref:Pre-mRNA-splicing factor Syf1/CRNKL1-like C-terminal HAT-repeats domain-containing protein n=1 Tax=Arcella intermedia TaxID=1963864 RepID=A0A6B2KYS8_9EUKA